MFDGLSAWTWVIAAWLQVVVAYGGYMSYLRRRQGRLEARQREGRSSNANG